MNNIQDNVFPLRENIIKTFYSELHLAGSCTWLSHMPSGFGCSVNRAEILVLSQMGCIIICMILVKAAADGLTQRYNGDICPDCCDGNCLCYTIKDLKKAEVLASQLFN